MIYRRAALDEMMEEKKNLKARMCEDDVTTLLLETRSRDVAMTIEEEKMSSLQNM